MKTRDPGARKMDGFDTKHVALKGDYICYTAEDLDRFVHHMRAIWNWDNPLEILYERFTGRRRTSAQNRALHLYFNQLSEQLNDSGLYMQMNCVLFREPMEVPWTPGMVKQHLWKPVQMAVVGHDKTRDLKKTEIDDIYEPLAKRLAQRGIVIMFPSMEGL